MKKNLLLLLTFFGWISGFSQDLKGLWHGYITGEGLINRSEYTLHVKSQTADAVTGRAYLYSNKLFIFQGIFDFIGKQDGNNLKITELRILSKEMPGDQFGLCIKYENVKYTKDSCEYLTGVWDNTRGRCPPGDVYLKRVIQGKADTAAIPEAVLRRIREDNISEIPFLNTVLGKPIILDVHQVALEITIKDYLKEDNDTVSVYFNRQEIIKNHRITNKSYTKKIKLDVLSGMNEIVIYAKNLGQIPPNTCTLIVYDGERKQKVSIISDKQTSAAVYLNYTLKPGFIYRAYDSFPEVTPINSAPGIR
ncbi:hypothetical protein [Desertivirga brevis]|uniref:hypothetical protein n=1 Tax=Desertivirga brevis TaxID=2810310 RepID=UPI001A95833F|nr:hypothetical protein [Pedobacter sp. SYSU D00873]